MTNSLARTVEAWIEIFSRTPAPESAEKAIASRILGDLWGYKHGSKYASQDVETLQAALIAYAKMLQEAGVKA